MRKGRSSRRSRTSFSPLPPPSSKSMLNADAATPSVPNIVIGVTPSPSSVSEIPPAVSTKSANAEAAVQLELPVTPSQPPVAVAPVRDTLVAPALPAEEEPAEEEEPASEERIRVAEKVEEPFEAKTEDAPKAEAVNLHDTLIDAQKIEIVKPETRHEDTIVDAPRPNIPEPEAVKASEAPKPNFEKTLPMGSAKDFAPQSEEPKQDAKTEEPKVEAKRVVVVQEEETIPPAGDLAVAEQFFSEGDVARHASTDAEDDLDLANAKAQRKSDPDVVKRRAKFAKYVTWAVGISAALCLIAVVRTTFSSSSKTITAANAASVKTEMVAKAPPPAVTPAPKAAEPAVKAAEPAAAPVEETKPAITGDVKEEKAKVKAALDKNKLTDAIEAGQRAVTIDETDSEAWLLLGAAYQAKGELKQAQVAYKSCMEKGTKDKFQRECRLFVR